MNHRDANATETRITNLCGVRVSVIHPPRAPPIAHPPARCAARGRTSWHSSRPGRDDRSKLANVSVRTAFHRLRERLKFLIRDEIKQTVHTATECEAELAALFRSFAS